MAKAKISINYKQQCFFHWLYKMVCVQTGGKKILEQFFDSTFFFVIRFLILNELNEHTEKGI